MRSEFPRRFYRRPLELRERGSVSFIVYAVFTTDGKLDPAPALGAFQDGWEPTKNPQRTLSDVVVE
jgi:hypothetical protein